MYTSFYTPWNLLLSGFAEEALKSRELVHECLKFNTFLEHVAGIDSNNSYYEGGVYYKTILIILVYEIQIDSIAVYSRH